MNSKEHIFGENREAMSAVMAKKKEATSKTITVKVNPEQVARQAARQPAAPRSAPTGSKTKAAKRPAKKEPEASHRKPKEAKASTSKASDTDKYTDGAGAKKKPWKGKKHPPKK